MAFDDIQSFIALLKEHGELHRVPVQVDPCLEIAALTDRVCKMPGGGKALLFEQVKGSAVPVVTNLFGSFHRVCLALGIDSLDALAERMTGLLDQLPAGGSSDGLTELFTGSMFSRHLPLRIDSGLCQQVIDDQPDLARYPLLQGWPEDGAPRTSGRFLTLPLVFTRDPETGAANCGMYRCEMISGSQLAIHWYAGKGGALHWRKWQERGERMPMAIALGGDPVLAFSALLPLPEALDEMQFSGFLRGAPIEMVHCTTSDLLVPAGAEMVIEGYIEPGEVVQGGTFGNHTGYYASAGEVPLLRLSAITRRARPVYPATIVGRPPMEDCYLAEAGWRLLLPLVKRDLPEVTALHLPREWIFHNSAIIAVRKAVGEEVKGLVERLWASRWFRTARLLILVDDELEVTDLSLVAWRLLNRVDWRRDLMIADAPAPAAFPRLGARVAIDATRKGVGDGNSDPCGEELKMTEAVRRLVEDRWREYGF